MDNKIKTKALIPALVFFLVMFVLLSLTAFVKYGTYGSFVHESRKTLVIATAGCSVSLLLVLVAYFTYLMYSRQLLVEKTKTFAVICVAIMMSCMANIGISAIKLCFMPVALTAFLLVPLVGKRDVFVANIITNLVVSVILLFESILGDKVDSLMVVVMLIVGVFSGSLCAYTMSNIVRRFTYVVRGIFIGIATMLILFLASLLISDFRFVEVVGFMCISTFGQILVGQLLQPIFEAIFNLVTNTKLTELTDHNAPLIKMLINDALGTFNHALSVSSFAEVCALRIGENPYLAKACAYYHDVGKIKNPTFFSENQSGYNPHDELLPEVSAQILRAHTTDGFDLCMKYHIPIEVAEVTLQHHGTLPMAVFYNKAKKLTDGDVNAADYSYHGQTPVSKVAAIIMLCDACEAALRARKPAAGEVDALVGGIINDRIARHQFDNCEITMRDLNTIKQTIIGLYGGVYHERVKYPSGKKDD